MVFIGSGDHAPRPLWTYSDPGIVSIVDYHQTESGQVTALAEIVEGARAELGDVLLHDPDGPDECLVRSGELVVLSEQLEWTRNRLRRWIDRVEGAAGAARIVLRPAEREQCVRIALDAGVAPNHVHLACPIMLGTSRPIVGDPVPMPRAEQWAPPVTVGLLDTRLAGGHGAFVAGVLVGHAPGIVLRQETVLSPGGFGDDLSLAAGLRRVREADVVLVASGTHAARDQCPPVLRREISRFVDTVFVAAAGNGGTDRPWWPAALPDVVAVGATDAGFSNHGDWVDEWADGAEVTSTFLGRQASCSGTSFAAARVAADMASLHRNM